MTLTLDDLVAFDPGTRTSWKGERRFLCPLPDCTGKPRDDAHRSLSVNLDTGCWCCHRCGNRGQLDTDRAVLPQRTKAQPPTAPPVWRKMWDYAIPIEGMPGADYLLGRGIPVEIAAEAGLRYSDSFYHRPALLFPVRGQDGALVGVQARRLRLEDEPRMVNGGGTEPGLFHSCHVALLADPLIVTEAPIDALSLSALGYPAVAALGCSLPDWVRRMTWYRRLWIATDADDAGDRAAEDWAKSLVALDGPRRLRPPTGDWNDCLRRDPTGLAAFFVAQLGPPIQAELDQSMEFGNFTPRGNGRYDRTRNHHPALDTLRTNVFANW